MGNPLPHVIILALIVTAVVLFITTKRSGGSQSIWLGGALAGALIGFLAALSAAQYVHPSAQHMVLFVYVAGGALVGAILGRLAAKLTNK